MAAACTVTAREVLKGLHPLDLRNLAKNREITTKYQSAGYVHRVRSRSGRTPRVSPDGCWPAADQATIDRIHLFLTSQRLLQVDLQVFANEPLYHVRLYVPLVHADLAAMAGRSLLPAPAGWTSRPQPDVIAIVLPEWSEQSTVMLDHAASTGYILGSDYYGDIHNSVLRIVAHKTRRKGHLALHAGSVEILARNRGTGALHPCGLLIFGAGGAGKTTLVCHDYGLGPAAGEKAVLRQDDRVILHPDGRVQGTEGQGLYVRTLGLSPQDRPALHAACTHEDAILENVWIRGDASIDFDDDTLTTNSRAIVPIRRIAGADGQVDLPRCTHVFFLVRDTNLPAAARIGPAQAAETFSKAEPVETGLPGDAAEDANRFLTFLQANPDVQCFLLNTAGLGPDAAAAVIRNICRQDMRWKQSPHHPFEEPA